MKQITLLSILLFLFIFGYSQVNKNGIPFITNYSSEKYEASEQNWAITQDNRGVMYFGNNDYGVLEYDGVNWRQIPINNNSIVRSLAIDNAGIIYVGAVNNLGNLTINNSGDIIFNSFSNIIDSSRLDFTDVWKTYNSESGIYFCNDNYIFNYSSSKLNQYRLPEGVVFSFIVNNKLYTPNFNKGLLKFKNGKTSLSKGGDFFKEIGVYTMNNFANKILIGTYPQGLFFYNEKAGNSKIAFKNNYINNFVKDNQLYSSSNYDSLRLLLGTIYDGMVVLNTEGKIEEHYNKSVGLQDETIIDLYKDNNKNIWLALNDGISKIEQNSQIRHFSERQGIKGAVLDICRFNDKLFVATTLGVFYQVNQENTTPEFVQLSDIKGLSFSMLPYSYNDKKQLLISTLNGMYVVNNDFTANYIDSQIRLKDKKLGTNYIQKLYCSTNNPDEIFVAVYNGVFSIKFDGKKWYRYKDYLTDSYDIRYIVEDTIGNIWFATEMNGIIKCENADTAKLSFFTTENGLTSNTSNYINLIEKQLVIGSRDGFKKLSPDKNKFISNSILPDLKSGIHVYKTNSNGNIWVSTFKGKKRWVERYVKLDNGKYEKDGIFLKRLPNQQFDAIYHDNNGITWLGSSSGLYSINTKINTNCKLPFNTLIRKVVTKNDSTLFNGTYYKNTYSGQRVASLKQPTELVPELIFKLNELIFNFAAPYFIEEHKTQYSYKLIGYNAEWSKWSLETKAVFTNLSEGKYTFMSKAKNIYGVESSIAEYNFFISPPWYRTVVAYVAYLIIIIFLIVIIVKIYTRRLEQEKVYLEGVVQERTTEIRKQKEDIELKNEVLQSQKEEITASIQYAQRIQKAIVPSEDDAVCLLKDYFLLWKPRDIVSGDFWWLGEKNGYVVVTAADCTGHGVPGAFMSMLGVSFLNQIVNQQNITESNKILNKLRAKVKVTLSQTNESSSNKDGMDMALLVIDMKNMKAQFSGAYNPLYLYRNNELIETKATRNPIGVYIKEKDFEQITIDLQKGDTLYLFSDGFPDQFGGDKDKKYSTKRFKQFLLSIQNKTMTEQKGILNDEIENWRGETGQIDDIIILGIRI